MSKPNWFAGSIEFGCTGCGKCCTADAEEMKQMPVVFITNKEADAIASFLGMTVALFKLRHTRKMPDGALALNWVLDKRVHSRCQFYDPISRLCGIHEVKPEQCRTFPFWPSVFKSRADWDAQSAMCEGINHGELFTERDILAKLKSCTIKPKPIKATDHGKHQ